MFDKLVYILARLLELLVDALTYVPRYLFVERYDQASWIWGPRARAQVLFSTAAGSDSVVILRQMACLADPRVAAPPSVTVSTAHSFAAAAGRTKRRGRAKSQRPSSGDASRRRRQVDAAPAPPPPPANGLVNSGPPTLLQSSSESSSTTTTSSHKPSRGERKRMKQGRRESSGALRGAFKQRHPTSTTLVARSPSGSNSTIVSDDESDGAGGRRDDRRASGSVAAGRRQRSSRDRPHRGPSSSSLSSSTCASAEEQSGSGDEPNLLTLHRHRTHRRSHSRDSTSSSASSSASLGQMNDFLFSSLGSSPESISSMVFYSFSSSSEASLLSTQDHTRPRPGRGDGDSTSRPKPHDSLTRRPSRCEKEQRGPLHESNAHVASSQKRRRGSHRRRRRQRKARDKHRGSGDDKRGRSATSVAAASGRRQHVLSGLFAPAGVAYRGTPLQVVSVCEDSYALRAAGGALHNRHRPAHHLPHAARQSDKGGDVTMSIWQPHTACRLGSPRTSPTRPATNDAKAEAGTEAAETCFVIRCCPQARQFDASCAGRRSMQIRKGFIPPWYAIGPRLQLLFASADPLGQLVLDLLVPGPPAATAAAPRSHDDADVGGDPETAPPEDVDLLTIAFSLAARAVSQPGAKSAGSPAATATMTTTTRPPHRRRGSCPLLTRVLLFVLHRVEEVVQRVVLWLFGVATTVGREKGGLLMPALVLRGRRAAHIMRQLPLTQVAPHAGSPSLMPSSSRSFSSAPVFSVFSPRLQPALGACYPTVLTAAYAATFPSTVWEVCQASAPDSRALMLQLPPRSATQAHKKQPSQRKRTPSGSSLRAAAPAAAPDVVTSLPRSFTCRQSGEGSSTGLPAGGAPQTVLADGVHENAAEDAPAPFTRVSTAAPQGVASKVPSRFAKRSIAPEEKFAEPSPPSSSRWEKPPALSVHTVAVPDLRPQSSHGLIIHTGASTPPSTSPHPPLDIADRPRSQGSSHSPSDDAASRSGAHAAAPTAATPALLAPLQQPTQPSAMGAAPSISPPTSPPLAPRSSGRSSGTPPDARGAAQAGHHRHHNHNHHNHRGPPRHSAAAAAGIGKRSGEATTCASYVRRAGVEWLHGRQPDTDAASPMVLLLLCPSIVQGGPRGHVMRRLSRLCECLSVVASLRHTADAQERAARWWRRTSARAGGTKGDTEEEEEEERLEELATALHEPRYAQWYAGIVTANMTHKACTELPSPQGVSSSSSSSGKDALSHGPDDPLHPPRTPTRQRGTHKRHVRRKTDKGTAAHAQRRRGQDKKTKAETAAAAADASLEEGDGREGRGWGVPVTRFDVASIVAAQRARLGTVAVTTTMTAAANSMSFTGQSATSSSSHPSPRASQPSPPLPGKMPFSRDGVSSPAAAATQAVVELSRRVWVVGVGWSEGAGPLLEYAITLGEAANGLDSLFCVSHSLSTNFPLMPDVLPAARPSPSSAAPLLYHSQLLSKQSRGSARLLLLVTRLQLIASGVHQEKAAMARAERKRAAQRVGQVGSSRSCPRDDGGSDESKGRERPARLLRGGSSSTPESADAADRLLTSQFFADSLGALYNVRESVNRKLQGLDIATQVMVQQHTAVEQQRQHQWSRVTSNLFDTRTAARATSLDGTAETTFSLDLESLGNPPPAHQLRGADASLSRPGSPHGLAGGESPHQARKALSTASSSPMSPSQGRQQQPPSQLPPRLPAIASALDWEHLFQQHQQRRAQLLPSVRPVPVGASPNLSELAPPHRQMDDVHPAARVGVGSTSDLRLASPNTPSYLGASPQVLSHQSSLPWGLHQGSPLTPSVFLSHSGAKIGGGHPSTTTTTIHTNNTSSTTVAFLTRPHQTRQLSPAFATADDLAEMANLPVSERSTSQSGSPLNSHRRSQFQHPSPSEQRVAPQPQVQPQPPATVSPMQGVSWFRRSQRDQHHRLHHPHERSSAVAASIGHTSNSAGSGGFLRENPFVATDSLPPTPTNVSPNVAGAPPSAGARRADAADKEKDSLRSPAVAALAHGAGLTRKHASYLFDMAMAKAVAAAAAKVIAAGKKQRHRRGDRRVGHGVTREGNEPTAGGCRDGDARCFRPAGATNEDDLLCYPAAPRERSASNASHSSHSSSSSSYDSSSSRTGDKGRRRRGGGRRRRHRDDASRDVLRARRRRRQRADRAAAAAAASAPLDPAAVEALIEVRVRSSQHVCARLVIPTLLLHAADDDVAPLRTLPLTPLAANPHVLTVLTRRGGHGVYMEHMRDAWRDPQLVAITGDAAAQGHATVCGLRIEGTTWLEQLLTEFVAAAVLGRAEQEGDSFIRRAH